MSAHSGPRAPHLPRGGRDRTPCGCRRFMLHRLRPVVALKGLHSDMPAGSCVRGGSRILLVRIWGFAFGRPVDMMVRLHNSL